VGRGKQSVEGNLFKKCVGLVMGAKFCLFHFKGQKLQREGGESEEMCRKRAGAEEKEVGGFSRERKYEGCRTREKSNGRREKGGKGGRSCEENKTRGIA